jgi:hypothetical protein
MTVNDARHRDDSPRGRFLGKRWVPYAAAVTAAALTAGAIATAGGGSAGAATPLSHATGRFLSGNVGNQSLDVLAGINGESATNPGDPGPNQNSLDAELLNNALKIPLGANGLQLPDPTSGAIELGAVSQYAKANANGSALGASGAVDSNGGIGVGGSNGVPKGGATLDLSGSQALSAVTSALADLKLTIGAVTARAQQAAIGKTLADPSAGCSNGPYSRVSDKDQAGSYDVASLTLDLNSPLLAQVGSTLVSAVDGLLTTTNVSSILNILNDGPLSGLVVVSGVPDVQTLVDNLLDLHLAGDAVQLSLADGSVHIDLEGLLKFLHLDIDNLCPNTSLLPYVVNAVLQGLPDVLSALITDLGTTLTNALGSLTVTVAGVSISAGLLTGLLASLSATIGTTLSQALGGLDTSLLQPLLKILTDNLLDIVVNAQDETSKKFTQTALQLNVLPGGGTATLPTLPGLQTQSIVKGAQRDSLKAAHAVEAKKTPAATTAPSSTHGFVKPAKVNALAAPAAEPVVGINLAQASVGPNSAPPAAPTTPAPSTSVPATNVPTGVPAGSGTHGTPVLPIALLALGLMFAAGGGVAFKFRRRLTQH